MSSKADPLEAPGAAATAFAAYKARTRFGNLDGLRFVCISMVIWHHLPKMGIELPQLFGRGFLGVDFFFVLSGYLITTLLLRESEKTGRISLKNFYIRRLVRIVPVYFFVVTLVAVYFIGVKGHTEYLQLLPFYYLFLSNFLAQDIPLLTITWSLSVEEQYYLIWPLLLILLPRAWLIPVSLLFVVLNVVGALGAFGPGGAELGPLLLKLPNSTYAPIILGSVAAVMLHTMRGFAIWHAVAASRFAALLGLIALCLIFQFGPGDVRGWPNLVIHLTMVYVLVALVVQEETVLAPLLRQPLIMRVGVVSYGIYLYHLIALTVMTKAMEVFGTDSRWLLLISYFALAYVMAEISFRTVEAWFQRFRPKG